MKFFINWMQNKFNNGGNQDISKPDVGSVLVPASCQRRREAPKGEVIGDLSDGGLLTIGTLGNHQHVPENHQDNRRRAVDNPILLQEQDGIKLSPDLTEFTLDEFGKLQKQLTKLLKRKPKAAVAAIADDDSKSQPLDRFLNCPSYRTISGEDDDDDIDRTIRIIIGRCKEVSKMNKGIFGKKSFSFLLKKMFLCSSDQFAPPPPAPGLRDTMQQSRMEKLLKTLMIFKKTYPTHNDSPALSTKRILESKYSSTKEENEDDNQVLEKRVESHKWVKTDSQYIVLDLD